MIVITGGSGFLGAAIARSLLEKGERVILIDLQEPPDDLKNNGALFLKTDIADKSAIKKALQNCEVIFHTAALVPIAKKSLDEFRRVNVLGTENVLEAAFANGARRFIFFSTGLPVYGLKNTMPINENSPQNPFDYYGITKYEAEKRCRIWREKGLNLSILRLGTVIGPGRLGSFATLFDWIKKGKNVYIIGNGKNKVQYLSLNDLLSAVDLIQKRGDNEDFNLGAGVFGTLEEDLQHLIQHAKSRSRIVHINPWFTRAVFGILDFLRLSPFSKLQYATFHLDFYFDISRAEERLGWVPRDSNAEMLKKAYDWYLSKTINTAPWGTTHNKPMKRGIFKILDLFS